jgi:hypothetical protein
MAGANSMNFKGLACLSPAPAQALPSFRPGRCYFNRATHNLHLSIFDSLPLQNTREQR